MRFRRGKICLSFIEMSQALFKTREIKGQETASQSTLIIFGGGNASEIPIAMTDVAVIAQ